MTDDTHAPRPFDCPACGHHHKADLHALVGHPDVHGKVPCAKCERQIWLSLDADGEAVVELYEDHLHEAAHEKRASDHRAKLAQAATSAAPAAEKTGGGTSLLVGILTAGIVAALVSVLMAGSGGKDADAGRDQRLDDLQQQFSDLQGEAAAARADASAAARKIADLEGLLEQRMAALAAAPKGDAGAARQAAEQQAALAEALAAVKAAYKKLDGRIEGNYVRLGQMGKRLEKIESR